jgi:dTDP-glucose 4,6-dehydratase|tara:strand:+ start:578 stop:1531 length:954 start_codon:yes stop_codon:yes gene_type:complete
MKIAITGAMGFIGSNFTRYMIEKYPSYDFVLVDKLTYASGENGFSTENLNDLIDGRRVKFFQKDICNKEDMYDALYMCHAVVNFAAESHVGRAMVTGTRHINSNDIGATIIGEVASDYHIRMVQISTDEVYGEIEKGKFLEDMKLNPKNRYSASKAAGEMNLRALTYSPHHLDLVITRSGNNYGIYQSQEKFVHVIAESIAKDRKIPVHGKGEEIREWLYVIDNCKAIDLVLHKGRSGEIYNIGSHMELPNIKLAEMAVEEFGGEIEFVGNRPGNDTRYSLDTSKIEALGWKPEAIGENFKSRMLETIDYYLKRHKR